MLNQIALWKEQYESE